MPQPINISGSRAAAILNLSSYNTPVNVWLEICESRNPGFCERNNYELPVFEGNASTRWGNAFEDAIVELAEGKIGRKISDREKFFDHDLDLGDSAITCHIDGRYHSRLLHEGKTTSAYYFKDNFGEPGTDEIPVEYQIQCQHQMICTGAEKVILSVLVFPKRPDEWEEMGWEIDDNNLVRNLIEYVESESASTLSWAKTLNQQGYFHQYEINADPVLQKLMLEKYADFWNNHVLTEKPPEPANYDDIKKLCREPVGTIIADEQTERFSAEYKQINDEMNELKKRKEQVKLQILKRMKLSEWTLDDESEKKWILRDGAGNKLNQFDGRVFR
jgi:predicted phage-related endonuclease